jgi:hypothetical protein
MGYVAFDTSALSNIVAEQVAAAALEEALARRQLRPVHGPALFQLHVSSNFDKVRSEMLRLAALGADRWEALVDARLMLRAEIAEGGLSGLRTYAEPLRPMFDAARSEPTFARHIAAQRPRWLRILGPAPSSLHDDALQRWRALSPAERKRLAPGLGGRQISPGVIGTGEDFVAHVLSVAVSPEVAARVRATPHRYRSNLANAALITSYILGNIMGSESTPNYPWLKREKDDRNDHNIAVYAAYCDVLVTDDVRFRARLGFLRERGCIFFEPLSLQEFLAP